MKYEEVEVNSERWLDLTPLLNEEFRDIKGFEGFYQISNYGRVKGLTRTINYVDGRNRHYKEKIKANQINRKGKKKVIYYNVGLIKNKEYKSFEIHRLVAQAFIPNPENKPTIDHIKPTTNNECDNRVFNLRWATYSEQQRHSFDNCNKISPMKGKINCYLCKEVIQYDENNNIVNIFPSLHEVQRQLGYDFKCISNCCIKNKKGNKIHKSYGYIWKFKEEC